MLNPNIEFVECTNLPSPQRAILRTNKDYYNLKYYSALWTALYKKDVSIQVVRLRSPGEGNDTPMRIKWQINITGL